MASSPNPVISIITVCYNAAAHIEDTLRSVAEQTYPYIEYLIVDGASTDQTLDIIVPYRSKVHQLISEPDQGIYDAMNKGLKAATGDYLIFLNADDQLYSPDIIEKIFQLPPGSDVYYGDTVFVDEQGKEAGLRSIRTPHKLPDQLDWKSLRLGMVVSHQAFIIKRSLAVPFDVSFKICGDIDWMIRCLKLCQSTCNTGLVVSRFRVGGASKKQQRLAWRERFRILSKYYGALPNWYNHLWIALRYLVSEKY